MRKIGLMTWFSYNNYGSLLQCKASIYNIKKMGYEVELINYKPKTNYVKNRSIKYIIKRVIEKLKYPSETVVENIEKYRQSLPMSAMTQNKSELYLLNKEYDGFVCGSDQIWSPVCFDENYFLAFVENDKKKIAYAPSFGVSTIENEIVKSKMKELINKFEHLAIREEQGAKIIKKLTGKKAEVVLDPTLLLDRNEWSKDFIDIKYNNYIIAYFLGDSNKYYHYCQKISKKLNMKLLIIPCKNSDYKKNECLKEEIGPNEFISLIDKANLVLTDSFHGTIFGLNFHKPIIVFKRFKDNNLSQNSRIYDILNILNVKQILFNGNIKESINGAFHINYKNVDKILDYWRKKSTDFLCNALRKVTNISKGEMKKITNTCTGCGICAAACPRNCISIEKNRFGFWEYKLDEEKCIKCGVCKKVCGQANSLKEIKVLSEQKLFAAKANDEKVLLGATSGGVCSLIAREVILSGGSVVGCKYDYARNVAVMDVARTIEEFEKMKGSKYLQAFTYEAYKKIKELDEGAIIGTPCQIASIDRYLKLINKRDKFILIDFICHGVPSYYLWEKYISKYDNINQVMFRNKKMSWRNKYMTINTDKSNYCLDENKDLFYHFFNIGNVYNEACYECKYRNSSMADIRVGDFWGPKYQANKNGVSMLFILTERGEKCIRKLEEDEVLHVVEENISHYLAYQQVDNHRIPLNYEKIINELKDSNISLNKIDDKYNKKQLYIRKIRALIKKVVKI